MPGQRARTALALTGVAALATGVTVGGGLLSTPGMTPAAADVSTSTDAYTLGPEVLAARAQAVVSRSDRRGATDATKAAALSAATGHTVDREENLDEGDPRDIARALLPLYGFDASQFSCLDSLYVSESNWRVNADNPSSSAYGIPQALTATHDLPAGYMTSAEVQIRWGLEYIKSRYGTPCSAWSFKAARGWY
ncbi:MAG: lytic transglycosylase domain-containing protein [Nocardioides sp.]|nr:lytic transglycosylase domain-containing protein [Nocardioides sp.]